MNNAGVYILGSPQLSVLPTSSLLTPILNLEGMTAVSLECNLLGALGGSTLVVIVSTSFDLTLWRHIARFDFTTGSLIKIANLSGLLSKAVGSYADLAAEGVNDGLLGRALALTLIRTGTYTAGQIVVNASVR